MHANSLILVGQQLQNCFLHLHVSSLLEFPDSSPLDCTDLLLSELPDLLQPQMDHTVFKSAIS